jgi:hypothetical protein
LLPSSTHRTSLTLLPLLLLLVFHPLAHKGVKPLIPDPHPWFRASRSRPRLFENNLDTIWRGRTDYNASTPISTNSSSYQRGQVVEYGGTAVSSSGWASSYGSYDNSTTAGKALVENNAGLLYAEGFCEWIASKFFPTIHVSPTRSPMGVMSLPHPN